jgi:hypothetical protein
MKSVVVVFAWVFLFETGALALPAGDENASYIQFSAIMAPTVGEDGQGAAQALLTVLFQVSDKDHIPDVCRKYPWISDAVLRVFYKTPLILSQAGRLRIDKVNLADLVKAANDSLGGRVVSHAFLATGGNRPQTGVLSRTTIKGIRGCKELKVPAPEPEPEEIEEPEPVEKKAEEEVKPVEEKKWVDIKDATDQELEDVDQAEPNDWKDLRKSKNKDADAVYDMIRKMDAGEQ